MRRAFVQTQAQAQVQGSEASFASPLSSASFDTIGAEDPIIIERDCGTTGEANGPQRSLQANTVELGIRVALPEGDTPETQGAQLYTRYSCIDQGPRP